MKKLNELLIRTYRDREEHIYQRGAKAVGVEKNLIGPGSYLGEDSARVLGARFGQPLAVEAEHLGVEGAGGRVVGHGGDQRAQDGQRRVDAAAPPLGQRSLQAALQRRRCVQFQRRQVRQAPIGHLVTTITKNVASSTSIQSISYRQPGAIFPITGLDWQPNRYIHFQLLQQLRFTFNFQAQVKHGFHRFNRKSDFV